MDVNVGLIKRNLRVCFFTLLYSPEQRTISFDKNGGPDKHIYDLAAEKF